jgi:hypothetical protein
MEIFLMTWFEDLTQKHIPFSSMMIMTKAKSYYTAFKTLLIYSYKLGSFPGAFAHSQWH